jgi:hypothetical protein
VSSYYGPSLLIITVLVMGLAVYAVPFPGNLLLFGAASLGALFAWGKIRRRARE